MAFTHRSMEKRTAVTPLPDDPRRLHMKREDVIAEKEKRKEVEAKLAAERVRLEAEAGLTKLPDGVTVPTKTPEAFEESPKVPRGRPKKNK